MAAATTGAGAPESLPEPGDILAHEELLRAYRFRLATLRKQIALTGGSAVQPAVQYDIDTARSAIERLKESLRAWGVAVTDLPLDQDRDKAGSLEGDWSSSSDPAVRTLRIPAYTALWRLLKPLARYDRLAPIDRAILLELTVGLREWYFEEGGLFLSEHSRVPYFELKEAIKGTLERTPAQDPEIPGDALGVLLGLASRLRASLAHDIGTRA